MRDKINEYWMVADDGAIMFEINYDINEDWNVNVVFRTDNNDAKLLVTIIRIIIEKLELNNINNNMSK